MQSGRYGRIEPERMKLETNYAPEEKRRWKVRRDNTEEFQHRPP
jgi:hypothetical protein